MLKPSELIYFNKKNLFFLPFLLIIYSSFGQGLNTTPLDSNLHTEIKKNTNPIIYAEGFFGGSGGDASGILAGWELNAQWHRSLFSIRYINSASYGATFPYLAGFVLIPIPVFYTNHTSEEWAFLYGWRFTGRANAVNISIGISENQFLDYSHSFDDKKVLINPLISTSNYWGIPYEVSYNFFKGYRRRIRIILYPIGKPTGLGMSMGFKFFGNISQKPFLGFAISLGVGYHKHYE